MAFVVAPRRPGSKPSLLASMPAELFGKFEPNGKASEVHEAAAPSHAKAAKPHKGSAKSNKSALAHPKEDVVRSEPYRRLVAARPCKNCARTGYSQAAHPPPTGKGRKEDDRECFPLCGPRTGAPGCHAMFDQYKLFTSTLARRKAKQWARETRAEIIAEGLWPKRLPKWEGK